MNKTSKFLLQAGVFITVCILAQWAYNYWMPADYQHPMAWFILGFISVITFGIHLFLLRAERKSAGAFVRGFLGTTTIKLFIYLGFMVLYAITHKSTATAFIGHFAAWYFAFLAFETTLMYLHIYEEKTKAGKQ